MKRIVLLLIIMTLGAATGVKAQQRQQVTREEAARAAMVCLNRSTTRPICTMQEVVITERRDSIGNTILYEVTFDSFSVLLSGSKACRPLLAQYHGSVLVDYDNLPDNLRWVIDGYIDQITPCFHNDTVTLYYNDDWNSLIENTYSSPRNDVEVGPFLTTRWRQYGCNNNNDTDIGYEYELPTDSCYRGYYKVGCGAVAMGQVLNYWKHPLSKSWKWTYDWCNMSDLLIATSPTFQVNRAAISRLLKDCAFNINTTPGCDQSTSSMADIRNALVSGFYKYSTDAQYETRATYHGDWKALIKEDLDNGRPVIYGGGVHTFVCDGYKYNELGELFFHANYGDGEGGTGYFTFDDISYYSNHNHQMYNFTDNQRAIVKIYPKPNDYIVLCDRDVHLDVYYGQYQEEIANGELNPWEILPVTVTNLTSASTDSPSSWRTIPIGEESAYRAQESITLKDGFTVERGADFAAIITPCDNCGSREYVARMLDSPMDNASEHAEQQNLRQKGIGI